MSEPCRIRQGLFDLWYVFHPEEPLRVWSGSKWVRARPNGIPTVRFQKVSNFPTDEEARAYCRERGLEPQ